MKSFLASLLGFLLCSSPMLALSNAAVPPDTLSYTADFQLKKVSVASQDVFQNGLPRGSAEYISDPKSGVATLTIEVQGLPPGTYQFIGSGLQPGFGTLTGSFTVEASSNANKSQQFIFTYEPPTLAAGVFLSRLVIPFLDQTGALVGDITLPGSHSVGTFRGSAAITSTIAGVTGFAKWTQTERDGKIRERFFLKVSGLASAATYTLEVDGVVVGTIKSTRSGRITTTKAITHFSPNSVLRMLDSNGSEVLRLSFE